MITLILRGGSLNDDRLLTEQLGTEESIEIALSTTPHLALRQDLEALIMLSSIAAELLNIRPSRVPVAFPLDQAMGKNILIYPAVVGTAHPTEPHWWRGELKAAWVVGYASVAPPSEELKRLEAAERLPMLDEQADYAIILDALEAMERHNATGAQPQIGRAGMEVSANWAPGTLRAYREYRARAEAGTYSH